MRDQSKSGRIKAILPSQVPLLINFIDGPEGPVGKINIKLGAAWSEREQENGRTFPSAGIAPNQDTIEAVLKFYRAAGWECDHDGERQTGCLFTFKHPGAHPKEDPYKPRGIVWGFFRHVLEINGEGNPRSASDNATDLLDALNEWRGKS